eukprot:6207545-Pleurochrysis_carterae.AAC.1
MKEGGAEAISGIRKREVIQEVMSTVLECKWGEKKKEKVSGQRARKRRMRKRDRARTMSASDETPRKRENEKRPSEPTCIPVQFHACSCGCA